jgi:tetrahydromethanopterin S-methyltransferase subunit B
MPASESAVKEKACEKASRLDETINRLIESLDPHISELEKRLTRKGR